MESDIYRYQLIYALFIRTICLLYVVTEDAFVTRNCVHRTPEQSIRTLSTRISHEGPLCSTIVDQSPLAVASRTNLLNHTPDSVATNLFRDG